MGAAAAVEMAAAAMTDVDVSLPLAVVVVVTAVCGRRSPSFGGAETWRAPIHSLLTL